MQNRESGAKASRWGHETARAIAAKLGASDIRRSSNECRLNNERIVIKCAAVQTRSVGVTYKMLDRVDRIVGAFQCADQVFELWALLPEQFRATMRATQSQGSSAGKVALVERRIFERVGTKLGRVNIETAG